MRREFRLPEGDESGLDARGMPWEAVIDSGARWIFVHDFPIPPGYNCEKAVAAVRIGPSYPDEQLDMVYFSPALSLGSGRAIAAVTPMSIDGKQFQQWSRHRTAENPWRPGLDDLSSHLLQVSSWLDREVTR